MNNMDEKLDWSEKKKASWVQLVVCMCPLIHSHSACLYSPLQLILPGNLYRLIHSGTHRLSLNILILLSICFLFLQLCF